MEEPDESEILADDLGFGSQDECHEYVDILAELGLIDGTAWSEGCIESHRMTDNAMHFGARKAAAAKGGKAKRDNAMARLTDDAS